MRRLSSITLLSGILCFSTACSPDASSAPAGETTEDNPHQSQSRYHLRFTASFEPENQQVSVTLDVDQRNHLLRQLNLNMPPDRYAMDNHPQTTREGDRVLWQVGNRGGQLSWKVPTSALSTRSPADATITPAWALVKLDDIFPAATTRTLKGASSVSTLVLSGPKDWRFETAYGPVNSGPVAVQTERNFNRPKGWMLAGDLGIRRTQIAGRRFSVAAPKGSGMARMDVIAYLNWIVPDLINIFPEFPERTLIIGAPNELWRGGLSGFQSLYLHQDRPIVSENATSPMIHELVHVAGVHSAAPGSDWLVEGLAEYYALEILRRSGGISDKRFNDAISFQKAWAERENAPLKSPSSGAHTAYAVTVMHDLALELEDRGISLDTITRQLLDAEEISASQLRSLVKNALGQPSSALNAAVPPK
ncbi:MAG: hypothetical protein AAF541_21935 [Pseudomonadota bacterium]